MAHQHPEPYTRPQHPRDRRAITLQLEMEQSIIQSINKLKPHKSELKSDLWGFNALNA